MSKYVLKCRTNENPEGFDWVDDYQPFTVGQEYEIELYDDFEGDSLIIVNDNGISELYSIEPDEDGHSYKTWFDLVEGDLDGR